jgi:hypothetical protein
VSIEAEEKKGAGDDKTQTKDDDFTQIKDEQFAKEAECCIIL